MLWRISPWSEEDGHSGEVYFTNAANGTGWLLLPVEEECYHSGYDQ